jgi:hypothetical protein
LTTHKQPAHKKLQQNKNTKSKKSMRMGCIHDVRSTEAAAHTSNDFGDEIYDIITNPRERTAYPYSWVHVLALYALALHSHGDKPSS